MGPAGGGRQTPSERKKQKGKGKEDKISTVTKGNTPTSPSTPTWSSPRLKEKGKSNEPSKGISATSRAKRPIKKKIATKQPENRKGDESLESKEDSTSTSTTRRSSPRLSGKQKLDQKTEEKKKGKKNVGLAAAAKRKNRVTIQEDEDPMEDLNLALEDSAQEKVEEEVNDAAEDKTEDEVAPQDLSGDEAEAAEAIEDAKGDEVVATEQTQDSDLDVTAEGDKKLPAKGNDFDEEKEKDESSLKNPEKEDDSGKDVEECPWCQKIVVDALHCVVCGSQAHINTCLRWSHKGNNLGFNAVCVSTKNLRVCLLK